MTDADNTPSPARGIDEIRVEHPFIEFARMYIRNAAAVIGLLIFLIIVVAALFAPILLDVDPFEIVWAPLARPGEEGFLLGTDNLGRDLFVGIVYGSEPR